MRGDHGRYTFAFVLCWIIMHYAGTIDTYWVLKFEETPDDSANRKKADLRPEQKKKVIWYDSTVHPMIPIPETISK